jgi:hypothetical protein
MTVLHKRTWFGSYATIHTTLFNCMVSTAPGLVRTTILVITLGPGDKPKRWPLAKAYLRRGFLSKKERDAVHDYIVNFIDQSGRFVPCEIEPVSKKQHEHWLKGEVPFVSEIVRVDEVTNARLMRSGPVGVIEAAKQNGKITNIGYALEGVFAVAKVQGAIVDYIIAPSAKREQTSDVLSE